MISVLADVICQLEPAGYWVLYNVFTRTGLGVDARVLVFLQDLQETKEVPRDDKYAEELFSIIDVGVFSHTDGLLADPTRVVRSPDKTQEGRNVNAAQLLVELQRTYITTTDEAKYRRKFASKISILDHKNFGNFHQQLGSHLMIERRQAPDDWWLAQKFTPDLKGVRDNLYRTVQEHFLKTYIASKFSTEDRVLDLGCGIGFFTDLIAETGASVTGLDPNSHYIDLARQTRTAGAEFDVAEIGADGALRHLPDRSFNYLFMSDALLFYFVPVDASRAPDIHVLLSEIKRLLRPGGCFISVEPSYIFWLAPWLGDERHPFTVLTEYRNRNFLVTPSLSVFLRSFFDAGFCVTDMQEVEPDPEFSTSDRGVEFARQFPLWQLFEFALLDDTVKGY